MSSFSIGLKCGWDGKSKGKSTFDQSKFDPESILLSGPYGDDVAFVKQSNENILIGLSDGVSGNRHNGLDPYEFAHQLIISCIEARIGIVGRSSLRGLVHRAIQSVEKRSIFGSATLCLLSIDKHCSSLRSLNIGDSGFMLIREKKLLIRSHPQYHRGSSPFQLSSIPRNEFFQSNRTRLYHDKPSDGEYIEENLQIGDLLLIASDGLFDNLYEDLILQIINNHLDCSLSVESLTNVCQILVQSASNARIKCDDILVLLFCVVPSNSVSMNERNRNNQSPLCLSSNSSFESILVDQNDQEPFDLFIFKD